MSVMQMINQCAPPEWERGTVVKVKDVEIGVVHPLTIGGIQDSLRPVILAHSSRRKIVPSSTGLRFNKCPDAMFRPLSIGEVVIFCRDKGDPMHSTAWAYLSEYRAALDQWDQRFNANFRDPRAEALRNRMPPPEKRDMANCPW